jgi:SnoaL-like protein
MSLGLAALESGRDPAAVAGALIAAENAGDIEGAVRLFHADAAIHDAVADFAGEAAIREWQTGLAAGRFHADIDAVDVDGGSVTLTGSCQFDAFRNLGIDRLDATWVLDVDEGRVRTFRFAFSPAALARLQAAQPAPSPS